MARKVKVDLSELAFAFESEPELEHFLDLETAAVIMVTEDDNRALEDFHDESETEEGEGDEVAFEKWLEQYDCPDWQVDSIRSAFLVEREFGTRFIRVPTRESRDGYDDMVDFTETVQDERLKELLYVALNGQGAFRRFKDVLLNYPEERERWFKFHDDQINQRVLDWLGSQGIEVES